MAHTVEEIGAKMDALGLWEKVANCHWALKPRGSAIPYFCSAFAIGKPPVRARFLLLEGWQTFHDFVRTRVDVNFGFYSSPIEFPHYELVVLADGAVKLFRHDPGYMPVEADERGRELCARLLWEAYGIMMRLESDPKLPLAFSEESAMFARVEGAPGEWSDAPLPIPPARAQVESCTFPKADLARAKDCPFAADFILDVDFRLHPELMTRESRPRCCYVLDCVDAKSGNRLVSDRASVDPETGLRGLWEGMPPRVLRRLAEIGRIPGEVRVVSGRVFRLLRPLCMELPFKLSLHDSLPAFAKSVV